MTRQHLDAHSRRSVRDLSRRLRAACAASLAGALLAAGTVHAAPIQMAELQALLDAREQHVQQRVLREKSLRAYQAASYADATEEFLAHRFAAAYGRFAQLADEGHVPSALIALTMVRYGRSMFGSDWDATPEQMQRWNTLATQDVRERAAAAD